MRVIESETTPSYNMGKNKKHKLRKAKEVSESSDEASRGVPRCNHINMGVNAAAMKKGLIKQVYGECSSCTKEVVRKTPEDQETTIEAEIVTTEVEVTLWVCLQCGNQGCDRNSRDKHALKHYETPRSSCHCLVVNTTSWTIWCYKCDDEVPLDRSKRLQECVDVIRKQGGLGASDTGRNSGTFTSGGIPATEQGSKASLSMTPRSSGSCNKLKGLSNLGNTCFFNAVMQNMTQTPCLESTLAENCKKGKSSVISVKHLSDTDDSSGSEDSDVEMFRELPPIEVILPEAGALTQSMLGFLQEMNNTSSRSSTVNPSPLFSQICKKAQRFRGYQQQDSHELLRYLLDNMRTEEIKRAQSGILKHFRLAENTNPKKVDDETKMKVKEYGREAKNTIIDSVFGGHLMSTVTCEECRYVSQIFEPFLDLSLPVTEEKPQRPNQMTGARKKDSISSEQQDEGLVCTGSSDKPSKHLEKKMKRQAKRNSKKKLKLLNNQVSPSDVAPITQDDGAEEGKDDEVTKGDDESSAREDPSDADIEDNLESDTSRCNKFGMDTSLNGPLPQDDQTTAEEADHRRDDPSPPSSSSSCTLTSTTSSTSSTIKQGVENDVMTTSISNGLLNSSDNRNSEDHIARCESSCNIEHTFKCQSGDTLFENGNVSVEYTLVRNGDKESPDCSGVDEMHCPRDENDVGIPKVSTAHQLLNGVTESPLLSMCDKIDNDIVTEKSGDRTTCHLINGVNSCDISNCDSGDLPKTNCNIDDLSAKLGNLNLQDSMFDSENKNTDIVHKQQEINGDNGHVNDIDGQVSFSSPQNMIKTKKEKKHEAQVRSKMTLGSRYQPTSRECTIMSCLHQFTSAELLTGNNKFGCANCTRMKHKNSPSKDKKETVYSNAAKQYLVFIPPAVLTLHLKRFEQVGFSSRKVNRHVDFPFVLDLAPYCSALSPGVKPGQKKILYALYGVVEHSGRLNAGHYTAYVKVRPIIGITNDFLNSGGPTVSDCIRRHEERRESLSSSDEQEESLVDRLVPPGRWYHISDSRVSETTESAVQRAQAYLLFYERIY